MGRAKFNPDIREFSELASYYGVTELANIYHKDRHCIANFAKRNNVQIYKKYNHLTEEQKAYCIEHHLDKTSYQLAEELNVSQASIWKVWEQAGLKNTKPAKRIYNFTENYFETVDTQNKAYWIGLLAADGNVHKQERQGQTKISITLQREDAQLLQNFAIDINTEKPIYYREHYATFAITSDKMASDLSQYGIVPKKTYHMTFPSQTISDELMPHYLRGYFDGDGSISKKIDEQHLSHTQISYCGYCDFLTQIQHYLQIKYNIKSVVHEDKRYDKYSTDKPFGYLVFTNKYTRSTFLNLIYTDAHRYLQRKKELADAYLLACTHNPKHYKRTIPKNAVLNSNI